MVPLMSLLLPILLAAVLVFVASSVIHMLLPYHRTDFAKGPEGGSGDGGHATLRHPHLANTSYLTPDLPR